MAFSLGEVEAPAAHETIEIMPALLITCRTMGKITDGTRGHRVVVFPMGLYVLSIFSFAVFLGINHQASHNGARAEGLRNAESVRKGVQPENIKEYHFNNHFWRKVVEF